MGMDGIERARLFIYWPERLKHGHDMTMDIHILSRYYYDYPGDMEETCSRFTTFILPVLLVHSSHKRDTREPYNMFQNITPDIFNLDGLVVFRFNFTSHTQRLVDTYSKLGWNNKRQSYPTTRRSRTCKNQVDKGWKV